MVGRDLIEDQVVADADEVYRNIAGMTSSPYASVVARGFTQRDFVFNGVRGNPYGSLGGDVNNSGFSVSQLQLSNIERIEILKGPASVLYGSTEPGGVVNYVTAKPQEEFGVRGSVRFGQYGQTYGSAEVTGPLGDSERVLYRFAAYGNERDSFRANASMRNVHLVGNLAWRISDQANLSFEYENIDQDLMGHRLRGVPVEPDGTLRDRHHLDRHRTHRLHDAGRRRVPGALGPGVRPGLDPRRDAALPRVRPRAGIPRAARDHPPRTP